MKVSHSVQTLEDVLAACLDDMQAGMTPAECLARYPEFAEQLEPALLIAERLRYRTWPALSTGGRVRGRERMHAALVSRRTAGFAWWSVLRPLSAAVMLLVLAAGVWLAWPDRQPKNISLPTSAPVFLQTAPVPSLTAAPTKTPTPTLTPTLTLTPQAPVATGEPNPELTQGNSMEMSIGADRTVTPSVTATVRVRNAPTSGVRVNTPESTQAARPTATVNPGRPQETPRNDETPEATVRPTETRTPPLATPSRTREPGGAPTPSQTAAATATHEPTATRRPTETHEPTETPRPSPSAEPTTPPAPSTRAPTNTPTKMPAPTNIPQPTNTPRPSPTVKPTEKPTESPPATATRVSTKTPEPSETPQPTRTPEPTEPPEATKTPDRD